MNVLRASFVVPGKPVPKERPRLNRRTGSVYTPSATREYRHIIAACAMAATLGRATRGEPPWQHAGLCSRRPGKRVKCACAWCSSEFGLTLGVFLPDRRTRDIDNIEKAILDACNGILWRDDRQALVEAKSRAIDRERPRVEVSVRCFPPDQ